MHICLKFVIQMANSVLSVYKARHSRNLVSLFLFGVDDMAVSFSSVTFQVGTPVCSRPAAAYNALERKKKTNPTINDVLP